MLGTRLDEERNRLGLGYDELADLLGVGILEVNMLETGRWRLGAAGVEKLRSAGFDIHYLLLGEREDLSGARHLDLDVLIAIIEQLLVRCSGKRIRLSGAHRKAIVTKIYLKLAAEGEVNEEVLEMAGVAATGESNEGA